MNLFGHEQETTTSDDYLTPAWVFEDLGVEFDMDVAASPFGGHVPAIRSLTKVDDGLTTPWQGRVWMNPPYSEATPWVRKFISHSDGIALVPWAKSAWTIELWRVADVIVLPSRWFEFDGGSIMLPVFFAGIGEWTRTPLSQIGHVR